MNESSYITSLRSRFYKKHPEAFFHKIPDANDAVQRPFDGFWIHPVNGFVAFEAKMHKSLSPWHFNKIEPHQISNLRIVHTLNQRALVILAVRCLTKEFDRKRLPSPVSRISMDIFIDASSIPGKLDQIDLKKLDIRSLAASLNLKGNKVNEVYLSKDRLTEFAS